MKILIIGGGNMGLTYARSFLRSHITSKEQLTILERSAEKVRQLKEDPICRISNYPDNCLASADLVIFAVKPQDARDLFNQINSLVHPQQVFLSIMAGIKIQTIAESLGVTKIIRAMPNLPAQIGMGMTAFTSTDEITRLELVMIQNLLNTCGKTIYVEEESAIDAATAISGSGPAYVFYFMDAMMKAAAEMGFSESESELLVSQTFKGAVDLYNKADLSCKEWIKRVSSRGGTTIAAMESFRSTSLYEDIISGSKAAWHRAKELGE